MTKTKLITGLSRALWDSDLVATRVSLAIGELLWAVMLLWPGETFDRPTYLVMSHVMMEEAWGLILLLSSATQITIVMGEYFHTGWARLFAGWNAVLWGFLCASMVLSVSPPPAAIGGEFALAFAALWVWMRPYLLADMYERVERESTEF
jgi:hypothetical protein